MVHKMTISGFFNYAFVGFCPMIDLVKCVYLQVLDVLGEAKKKKRWGRSGSDGVGMCHRSIDEGIDDKNGKDSVLF